MRCRWRGWRSGCWWSRSPRTAAEIEAHAGAADVVGWYHRHDIAAEERSLPLVSDPASQLKTLAVEEGASVIVAGAYGHSRTHEWVFGGVTHDFMTRGTSHHLLLSH